MKKFVKIIGKIMCGILVCLAVVLLVVIGLNIFVKLSVNKKIVSYEDATKLEDVDCIVVLGASVKNGDTPSLMLKDRLDAGVDLYFAGVSDRILMSGDRTDIYYDEVGVMKNYAIDKKVPSGDIFIDPAGYSTYESIYRAKEIYGADKIVVVTQKYHLYRALYIAEAIGIDAYGVAADGASYVNQWKRDLREVFAIDKDFFKALFKVVPGGLGEKISLDGDGDCIE